MAVPTINVTCTVTNQTGAVVAGATVTAQLTGIDVYGTNYIFPSIQSFVTDINGLVTMPLFPNALGARRTAYQFIATDPVTGRALINITAVVPNQNIDLSVLDAITKLPAYAPPLTQPFSAVLTSMASSAALFSMSQLVPAADQMMYFSGPSTALLASLTAFGRSLIASANAAAAATTLGLGTGNSPTFAGLSVPTLTASTSVVTPLVQSSGTADFTAQVGVAYGWSFSVSPDVAFFPVSSDNVSNIGRPTKRWLTGFISNIDSGTAGSLALRTNNGLTQVLVNNAAVAPDRPININAGQSGVLNATISVGNGVGFAYSTGDNSHQFYTDASTLMQFEITRTVGANRHAFVTGSNGGNPIFGVTAGGMDFSAATVRFTGIGTTAVAANATLNAVGSNDLLRSTSSKRYKTEIEALSLDEALTLLRKLNPITYASLSEHDDPYLRHSGFIAEEVFDINPLFVSLSNKRPESVQYERLTVPLVAGWQDHDTRLAALEARIH